MSPFQRLYLWGRSVLSEPRRGEFPESSRSWNVHRLVAERFGPTPFWGSTVLGPQEGWNKPEYELKNNHSLFW